MTCVMAGLVVVDAQAGRGHPARPTLTSVADRRTGWARWGRTWLTKPDTLELRWDD
jgi:hypothetical protein